MTELIAGFAWYVLDFVVNYNRSLNDFIVAGCYDWVNEEITEEEFPATNHERGRRKQNFKLFHFKKEVGSEEAMQEIERNGYRCATLRELLAFGEVNPEFQRQFPVIALGSIQMTRRGDLSVPGLWYDLEGRNLQLFRIGLKWSHRSRFLAVSVSK